MKTIRHNTFETNSSSTHSITVISKSKESHGRKHLVIENRLFPENLAYSGAYTSIDEYCYDGRVINAHSLEEKISLFLNYLFDITQNYNSYKNDYDLIELSDEDIKNIYDSAFKYLSRHYLNGIEPLKETMRSFQTPFYAETNNMQRLHDIFSQKSPKDIVESLSTFVTTIIEDPDKSIIDKYVDN